MKPARLATPVLWGDSRVHMRSSRAWLLCAWAAVTASDVLAAPPAATPDGGILPEALLSPPVITDDPLEPRNPTELFIWELRSGRRVAHRAGIEGIVLGGSYSADGLSFVTLMIPVLRDHGRTTYSDLVI